MLCHCPPNARPQAAGAGVRGRVPAGEVLRGVPRAPLRRPRRRGVRRLDPALQQ